MSKEDFSYLSRQNPSDVNLIKEKVDLFLVQESESFFRVEKDRESLLEETPLLKREDVVSILESGRKVGLLMSDNTLLTNDKAELLGEFGLIYHRPSDLISVKENVSKFFVQRGQNVFEVDKDRSGELSRQTKVDRKTLSKYLDSEEKIGVLYLNSTLLTNKEI